VKLVLTPASQWNVIGPNNFAGLNTHVYDGCGCPAPTGFAVMNITSSTFKAVWDAMPGATKYQVWYRQSGIGAPWSKKNTTTNSKKIIGLLPSTLYEVKVKTFCGVLGSEFTTTLFVTTGPLRAGEIESSFNLFPNPNNGLFTIELPTDLTENADLFIYDITGALVLKQTVEAQTNSLTIDLTKLPKGSYIVRLISVNSASTEILVIE